MTRLKIGDVVARKSYGCDIFFKVVDITGSGGERIATLRGISYRIEADAPESDLEVQPEIKVREYWEKSRLAAGKRNDGMETVLPYYG